MRFERFEKFWERPEERVVTSNNVSSWDSFKNNKEKPKVVATDSVGRNFEIKDGYRIYNQPKIDLRIDKGFKQ